MPNSLPSEEHVNFRFEFDFKAKVTTTNDKEYKEEVSIETYLDLEDLGIEKPEDWIYADDGMIYGEAFKTAMNAFYDNYTRKGITNEVKEVTITIKNIKII